MSSRLQCKEMDICPMLGYLCKVVTPKVSIQRKQEETSMEALE